MDQVKNPGITISRRMPNKTIIGRKKFGYFLSFVDFAQYKTEWITWNETLEEKGPSRNKTVIKIEKGRNVVENYLGNLVT